MLCGRRQFHTSKWAQFKQKAAGKVKKTKTPNKQAGVEHRSFREAASYSHFQQAAVEVPGLEVYAGQAEPAVYNLPENVAAALTHLGSFPPQQNSELFKQRASLFRAGFADLLSNLDGSKTIITGPSGIGKSTLLSQVQAAAKSQGWALVHIPRAVELIDGSSDFALVGDKWLQPMYTKRLFNRIEKANRDVLSAETKAILKSRDAAAFEDLFKSFAAQKVLLSIDGLNAWSHQPLSTYRTKDNEPIYHGDLHIPKTVLGFFGEAKFNGAIAGATTGLYETNDTFKVAFGTAKSHSYASVEEFDPRLSAALSGAKELQVPYLTIDETRTWLEYLQKAGVAPATLEETALQQAFTTSAGNPRNFLRSFINYSF